MRERLPAMLKDAAGTALVAAALGLFIVGFRTRDVGQGLFFDYQLTDLAIAVVTIFFGRLGLQLASIGLKWPAFALGAAPTTPSAVPSAKAGHLRPSDANCSPSRPKKMVTTATARSVN